MNNQTKHKKNYNIYLLLLLAGVVIAVGGFIYSAKLDMDSTEKQLRDTVNYISKQCSSYNSLNLASETKSLLRVSQCAQEVSKDIKRDLEEKGLSKPNDQILKEYIKNMYLSGVIIMDASGNVTAQYHTDGVGAKGLKDELKKDTLLEVADYPQKTYMTRITRKDTTYIDLAAYGRKDTSEVIVVYYHTPLEYVQSYTLSYQTLLAGYSIVNAGTVVVSDGKQVIASNEKQLQGKDVNEIKVLRNMNQKDSHNKLIHVTNDKKGMSQSFGILEQGRDYYVYAYLPENIVFTSTPRRMLSFMIGYVFVVIMVLTIRLKTAQRYREEQYAKERRYQEKLRESQKKAESANIAKTEFLQRMSHDIRTPINGIRGMIEIAEHYSDDPVKLKECRQKVWEASGLLLELVNEVLDMGKLESGEIILESRPFHVLDLTEEIKNVLEKQAAERTVQIIDMGSEVIHPYVIGSPIHVKRLLMNIISNAIKYNKENGEVRVSCNEIGFNDNKVWIQFICEDTGIGMSKEFQEHLFEPFTQENQDSRSIHGGTGLGMAITKSLIDKMEGTIEVESEQGIGTKYQIVIPFYIDKEKQSGENKDDKEDNNSIEGMQILLVEDNDLNMEIAEFLLEEAGAIITQAHNGKEAVDTFEQSQEGTFDAILMDVMMPVMGGYEASENIRKLNRPDAQTIPILAMTANAFVEDRQRSMEAGLNEHLTKPLEVELVLKTLAKYYKGK